MGLVQPATACHGQGRYVERLVMVKPILPEAAEIAELLGGPAVLGRNLQSALQAHDLLVARLPRRALAALTRRIGISNSNHINRTIGARLRAPSSYDGLLNAEQSARVWVIARVFNRATKLLGSEEDTSRWLFEPATALNRYRPIELLATPVGTQLVENLLVQLEFGVYV